MNHGNKKNSLGRKNKHRKSMLSNMASSLIKKKRIFTTLAKAKVLRKYIEPIITKSKSNTTHARRRAFFYLKDKKAVSNLFDDSFNKVRKRLGGYTRILRSGYRNGDNSIISFIELVDFNENFYSKKIKTTRKRRKKNIKVDNGSNK
ncbi:50S ribosomal protein L17 [Blattabacterium cuenoti]|nr:50S ribosomal protein L17 [Blattabacterium cuenoti]